MKLVLLLASMLLVSCHLKTGGQVSEAYNIKVPTSGKHHAVVKILTDSGGGCTAFVISNRKAITAGHCIEVSRALIRHNKEGAIVNAEIFIEKTLGEMNSVDCDTITQMPKLQCITIKKSMLKEINNAKRYIDKLKKEEPDSFKVFNSLGKEVKIKVTALDSELGHRDFAVLSGDFSEFEKIPLATSFDVVPGELLRSCGYANLKTPAVCSNFIALGNSGFSYKGNGYLVKGMSGGPVVNSAGKVVGINIAVGTDEVLMTPTVGLFDAIIREE